MGRPKGSKNKKTLEREEFAKRFAELNAELNLDEGKTEIEDNNIQYLNQPESVLEGELSNLSTEGENQKIEEENNLNKLDNKLDEDVIESETETEVEVEVKTEEGEIEESKTKTESPKIKNKKEKQKTKICCERCGKEIYCEPRKIDTNVLTGMADYYRQARRRIVLCDNCCKALSELVDSFLIDVNQGGNEELKKF